MSLYRKFILPNLINLSMKNKETARCRSQILSLHHAAGSGLVRPGGEPKWRMPEQQVEINSDAHIVVKLGRVKRVVNGTPVPVGPKVGRGGPGRNR